MEEERMSLNLGWCWKETMQLLGREFRGKSPCRVHHSAICKGHLCLSHPRFRVPYQGQCLLGSVTD